MKKISKFTIFFTIFFLANCSWLSDKFFTKFPDSNNFINRFGFNKKGIVIFKLSSRYPSTIWCKYNEKKYASKDDCFEIKPSKYYQILMLEPQIYEIYGFEMPTRFYQFNNINPRFSQNNQERKTKPELAFEAKEKTISFLGNINYRSSKIINENSYEQDFSKIHQAFLNQDLKNLKKIFKGHKYEIEILSNKLQNQDSVNKYFIKDEIKTKKDFKEEKVRKIKKTKKAKKKTKKSKSKYEN